MKKTNRRYLKRTRRRYAVGIHILKYMLCTFLFVDEVVTQIDRWRTLSTAVILVTSLVFGCIPLFILKLLTVNKSSEYLPGAAGM